MNSKTFDLTTLNFSTITKIFVLAAAVLYTTYAVLVFKQVRILNQNVKTKYAFFLETVALVHLLLSLGLLLLSLIAVFT